MVMKPISNTKIRLTSAASKVSERTPNPTKREIKLSSFILNFASSDWFLFGAPMICFQGEKRVRSKILTENMRWTVFSRARALAITHRHPEVYHQLNIETISIRLLYQSLSEVATIVRLAS